MKFFTFLQVYGNENSIVEKLRSDGLLKTRQKCNNCNELMYESDIQEGDGKKWKCMKRGCRKTRSIRTDSFFAQARLSLCHCMLFIHLWSKGYSEKLIADDFPFSKVTIVDWSRFCRELCVQYFDSSEVVIGGVGKTVELDETVVVKRKYNRGRMLTTGWLFGGIERNTDGTFRCFMCLVYNRSESHLTYLIRRHVAPGTHIITDGWAAYRNLSQIGYEHSVVIHEENFVSPVDQDVHTQTIEATWCSLKRFIRSRGTSKGEHLIEYIYEWIFRRMHSDVFEALLEVIRSKYTFTD